MTCSGLLAVTPYITGADKCFFSNLLNRRRLTEKHSGTGVMPVIINKNKMTNQSGIAITCRLTGECLQEDERKCRQHQGQGRVPQYQRRHCNTFHAAAPRDSSIRCCIHCSTSLLYQRLLRPSLMGFGKWPSLISL